MVLSWHSLSEVAFNEQEGMNKNFVPKLIKKLVAKAYRNLLKEPGSPEASST
jgi:hypothetical protein